MRVALAPLNPTVGTPAGNAALVARAHAAAKGMGAHVVVAPELVISGYPPRDLLLEGGFVAECQRRADGLAPLTASGPAIVAGCPVVAGGRLRNALLVYADGRRAGVYHKRLLPTYDVFDEDRYFVAGETPLVIGVGGGRLGLAICEDLWMGADAGYGSRYEATADPVGELAGAGAGVVVAPSASPFVEGKHARHGSILREHARRRGLWVLSVNQSGANDDLIFDGHALAVDPAGRLRAAGEPFGAGLTLVDTDAPGAEVADPLGEAGDDAALARALVVGVRDYCAKARMPGALVGLSGGIDSAVTCALAVAALGPGRVTGVAMPGPYSSDHALEDARALADALGVGLVDLPIVRAVEAASPAIDRALGALGEPALGADSPDLAEQNIQSRLRGLSIMALSNRTGAIVLTTGNKSELAVGYCTLYGDMNGGLGVLADVPKTRVYALARALNADPGAVGLPRAPIPERTLVKPPSAELAPDQVDSDTLPPYEVLDRIVELRVEDRLGVGAIASAIGGDRQLVARVCRLIALNEYKRRQYAVSLKVRSVAFGPGRRMPVAQGWFGGAGGNGGGGC